MSRQDPKRGGITLLGVAGGIAAAMLFVALNSGDEDAAADAPVLIDSAPASTSVPVHAASLERAPAARSALRSEVFDDGGIDWSRVERAPEMPTF